MFIKSLATLLVVFCIIVLVYSRHQEVTFKEQNDNKNADYYVKISIAAIFLLTLIACTFIWM